MIKKTILLTVLSLSMCSCKLLPYKSDFDCPIPEGLNCKSLYEVNKMVDQGLFDPENGNFKLSKGCNSTTKNIQFSTCKR